MGGMPCIYVLKSEKTGKTYVGSSREKNAEKRLAEHNSGKTLSTKHGTPWKLVHQEQYADYTDARKRELFLKSGRGRELVKQLAAK